MSLDGGVINGDRPQQRVQRHVADVLVIIQQKSAKNIYRQNPTKKYIFLKEIIVQRKNQWL